MTTQEMLDKLQEKFGRKDLSFGCAFKFNYDIWVVNCAECDPDRIFAFSCSGDKHSIFCDPGGKWNYKYKRFSKKEFEDETSDIEIIGHPLTTAEILKYLDKCYKYFAKLKKNILYLVDAKEEIADLDLSKNLLATQKEETIKFIYNFLILKKDA